MHPYVNRVKAVSGGRVYTLPINLLTINSFFGQTLGPAEAKAFLESKQRRDIEDPQTFEEQALRFVGDDLYQAFFYGYTRKQWGMEPSELPASILKRLPIRFNYDDNYFAHPFQAMPKNGYTEIVQGVLDHPNIEVRLGCAYEDQSEAFAHVFWSGPIDRWFGYREGRLGYRSLTFEPEVAEGDFQGTAVMNYCDEAVPFTRITEHKHFSPWEADSFDRTIVFREYSKLAGPEDIPYYPIRLAHEQKQLNAYVDMARDAQGVTFVGRLGTYRYLDMDVTIREALDAGRAALDDLAHERPVRPFYVSPI
jgi:UDP-galactopyranose mutase